MFVALVNRFGIYFDDTEPGFTGRIIAEYIKRIFAGMKAANAGLNLSFMLVFAANLILKAATPKVLIKPLVSRNRFPLLRHVYLLGAARRRGGRTVGTEPALRRGPGCLGINIAICKVRSQQKTCKMQSLFAKWCDGPTVARI